jgi:hypothetical protein
VVPAMTEIVHDPWNTSNSVPHFTPLKSAEFLTDPAVIKAYNEIRDEPYQIRFIQRISRNLHFGIWIRSVVWFCSLIFAIAVSFMMIVRMDFHMKSLIYPQATVNADEENDDSTTTMAIQSESEEPASEERVTEKEGPVIR